MQPLLLGEIHIKNGKYLGVKVNKNKTELKIYLDLDGCIVDFLRAVSSMAGLTIVTHEEWSKYGKQYWPDILALREKFWAYLDWTPEGKELLYGILNVGIPTILSAYPSRATEDNVHYAVNGKRLWLDKNIPDNVVDEIVANSIIVKAIDKQLYAAPDAILIDDSTKNIEQWIAAGGIGILHEGDAARTLAELNFLTEKKKNG